ncbi:serine protease [archaeon]|nr:MAG: serine protease [archaeon]
MFRGIFRLSAKARDIFKTSKQFASILPQKKLSSNSRFAKIFLGCSLAAFTTITIACVLKKEDLMAMCYNGENEDDKRRFSLPLTRNFVADVVESVSPAVVNIACMSSSYMGMGISGGSGFIINREGFIVTNAHVVANGDSSDNIVVTMKSGRKRRASLYAMDVLSDIAVLKLEDMDDEVLPVAPLGMRHTHTHICTCYTDTYIHIYTFTFTYRPVQQSAQWRVRDRHWLPHVPTEQRVTGHRQRDCQTC